MNVNKCTPEKVSTDGDAQAIPSLHHVSHFPFKLFQILTSVEKKHTIAVPEPLALILKDRSLAEVTICSSREVKRTL